MNDRFAQLGSVMVRGRWIVLAIWIVLVAGAGALFAPKASSVTKGGGFGVPGSQSLRAQQILAQEFNASSASNAVVVFHSNGQVVDDPAYAREVTTATDQLKALDEVSSVVSVYNTGNPAFVSADRHTTFVLVGLKGNEDRVSEAIPGLREQLTGVSMDHAVTGLPAINYDSFKASERDLRRSELFTVPIVLFLLLIVFRTGIAAAIPLILGGSGVVLALAALYFVGSRTDLSIFALNIASMLGLGLGIDFSLILISRYREERTSGRSPSEAVTLTMVTGGRSITYSAITVILSMSVVTLLLRHLMIVRSISLGVMLVAIAGLLAGLTLLPALLAIIGDRLEWLRVMPKPKPRTPESEGFWYRLSHGIMRRPWRWLVVCLIIMFGLAIPLRDLAMSGATTGVLPSNVESVRGSNMLKNAFGDSLLDPIQIVIRTHDHGGVWTPAFLDALDQLTNAIKADRRVADVSSLSTVMASVPRDGRYQALTPNYFVPAPGVSTPGTSPSFPGISSEPVMFATTQGLSAAPAVVGLAEFSLEPGKNVGPSSGTAQSVIRLESGSLTVHSDGHLTLLRSSQSPTAAPAPESIPPGASVTLNGGDQLVIPPQTSVSFASGSQTVTFMGVVEFAAQPGTRSQPPGTAWPDPFNGMSRTILASGIVDSLPTGATTISVQRVTVQPGASMVRHTQPGPELISIESGGITIFSAPEIATTGATGGAADNTFDTPISLGSGSVAVVQAGGISHWASNGDAPAIFYSTKILDAKQPPLTLVGVAQEAAQFVNINRNNDTAVISITARTGEYTKQHQNLVYDLRSSIIPGVAQMTPYDTVVGGNAAAFVDFRDSLYGRFPVVVAIVTVMIFFILMMFFQSVFLPLKAMFMNLASIMATYGVLVMIFQYGWGARLFGFTPQGLVSAITPAVLYVILFALSTDYEVFMLSRVKEHFHETGNNEEAVASGLESTAGVITAAGLILVGTFGSFATAEVVTIKEIGLGLAIGVLIDSTIVRVIMVPATMRLMGANNWWMPAWLKGIVPELREGPSAPPQPVGAPAFAMAGTGGGGGVIYAEPPAALDPPPAEHQVVERPRRFVSVGIAQLRAIDESLGLGVIQLSSSRPLTIGRDEGSDLQLRDGRVSRHHAQISYSDGQYIITDLGSSNGVLINGKRIDPDPARRALHDGDHIEIGTMGAFEFVFELRREL